MKKLKSLSQSFLISSAIALFGSASAANDLIDTAAERAEFSTLVKLIKSAGLEKELKGMGPFTVFAPTDAAFAKLPVEQLERLANDAAAMRRLLALHLVPGVVITSEVRSGIVNTSAGHALTVDVAGNGLVRVNHAAVVAADLEASNGVLHGIDTVLGS